MQQLTYGSLFAGIGGFDLGFDRAGMTCKWQVEINEFCNKVLEKHWPEVERLKDVRECGKENLSTVDVICGGFPCQPHSYAGKRKGAADDRDLWSEFKRIIEELRPRWIVGENVPGIRTSILDQVLSDLEGLGYSWETAIIPAVAFDAPHRRDRVWIVGYSEHAGLITPKIERGIDARGDGSATGQSKASKFTGSGKQFGHVAHASSVGLQNGRQARAAARAIDRPKSGSNGSGRTIEPSLGMLDDGVSSGLAGYRWLPEPGISRVAAGVPDRVKKITALGNALVPQIAQFIAENIIKVEEYLETQ